MLKIVIVAAFALGYLLSSILGFLANLVSWFFLGLFCVFAYTRIGRWLSGHRGKKFVAWGYALFRKAPVVIDNVTGARVVRQRLAVAYFNYLRDSILNPKGRQF
jgi:hypothetical protein